MYIYMVVGPRPVITFRAVNFFKQPSQDFQYIYIYKYNYMYTYTVVPDTQHTFNVSLHANSHTHRCLLGCFLS